MVRPVEFVAVLCYLDGPALVLLVYLQFLSKSIVVARSPDGPKGRTWWSTRCFRSTRCLAKYSRAHSVKHLACKQASVTGIQAIGARHDCRRLRRSAAVRHGPSHLHPVMRTRGILRFICSIRALNKWYVRKFSGSMAAIIFLSPTSACRTEAVHRYSFRAGAWATAKYSATGRNVVMEIHGEF